VECGAGVIRNVAGSAVKDIPEQPHPPVVMSSASEALPTHCGGNPRAAQALVYDMTLCDLKQGCLKLQAV
jgi:hypothetical protein